MVVQKSQYVFPSQYAVISNLSCLYWCKKNVRLCEVDLNVLGVASASSLGARREHDIQETLQPY